MRKIVIYQKKGCSKCKAAMDLLEQSSCEIEKHEYLEERLSPDQLKDLLQKLGLKAFDLVRVKEPLYIEKFSDRNFSDEEWIQILFENPELIQRPIIVEGDKAIIGREPEKIGDLLNKKIE